MMIILSCLNRLNTSQEVLPLPRQNCDWERRDKSHQQYVTTRNSASHMSLLHLLMMTTPFQVAGFYQEEFQMGRC